MVGLFQTRERRALVVFLLLAGVFVAGLLLAERRKSAVSADRVEAEMEATVAADSVRLFEFDPNTVEYADLRRLGLSSRMAVSLLKYRAAGKVFRIPEDVATCYGMTDSVYFILEPYIRIGREYALTPSPRREYREYVPQEPRRIVPRERFRIDTVSASYLASLGFSVRQAEAIVRYRDLYEGLRDEAGFRACYMIADSVADLLLPYVIFPKPEPVRSGLIELNGADSATLRSVVGIGEKSVMAIIRYRERLGGFYSVDQLAEVPQVTESNFERIVKQIYCDSFKIRKIDINFAPPSTLKGHPYLPPAVFRKLFSKRQLKGGWSTVEELVEEHILTPREAVESILSNKPDVLFLDITMPGRSGIELAETLQNLKTPPVVVFVTAFAEYAADAYNLDAVDYVVKPVEDARLSKALDKIEAALGARRVVHAPRQPLRLTVDRGGKKVFIPVADVCYFEARADFCNAACAEGTYLINESISSLERRLASEGFIRVHRSYLVNLEDVHNVEIGSTGLMELRLDRVSSTVPVSRRRAAEVKSHLGLA